MVVFVNQFHLPQSKKMEKNCKGTVTKEVYELKALTLSMIGSRQLFCILQALPSYGDLKR